MVRTPAAGPRARAGWQGVLASGVAQAITRRLIDSVAGSGGDEGEHGSGATFRVRTWTVLGAHEDSRIVVRWRG
jgi:hypothetical protein